MRATTPERVATWENVPPDMCAQRRLKESQREKTYLQTCALNETWNHPMHSHSLIIRTVWSESSLSAWRKNCILSYPKCALRRFWLDCANVQSYLNLPWAHMSEGTFPYVAAHLLVFITFYRITLEILFNQPMLSGRRHGRSKSHLKGGKMFPSATLREMLSFGQHFSQGGGRKYFL